jgi:signal transduction histidine kinase
MAAMSASTAGSGRHIEAIELFADLLGRLDEGAPSDAFYGQLCDAICRLTSVERAVLFLYDPARRRVRAAGTHGLDLALFTNAHVSVESAPMARQALVEDRVVEALEDPEGQVPAPYGELLRDRHVICTPMAASGRWVGVVIADRARTSAALADDERDLLWTLGKTAALAALAQIATRQAEKARQLQQRIDIAREIHDGVIQRLFGMSLALGAEAPLSPEAQARCADELHAALADLREALQRPLSRPSRPTAASLVEELERLSAEHPDLTVELSDDSATQLPEELEPLAQSVLAEAVRNAHKHASPAAVTVRVSRSEDAFALEVVNDGVRGRSRTTGMGLRLAAFEALQHGGVLEFGERGEDSWQVKLVVPHDAG